MRADERRSAGCARHARTLRMHAKLHTCTRSESCEDSWTDTEMVVLPLCRKGVMGIVRLQISSMRSRQGHDSGIRDPDFESSSLEFMKTDCACMQC